MFYLVLEKFTNISNQSLSHVGQKCVFRDICRHTKRRIGRRGPDKPFGMTLTIDL